MKKLSVLLAMLLACGGSQPQGVAPDGGPVGTTPGASPPPGGAPGGNSTPGGTPSPEGNTTPGGNTAPGGPAGPSNNGTPGNDPGGTPSPGGASTPTPAGNPQQPTSSPPDVTTSDGLAKLVAEHLPDADERRTVACATVFLGDALLSGELDERWSAVAPSLYVLTKRWPDLFSGDFGGANPPTRKTALAAPRRAAAACPARCDAPLAFSVDSKFRERMDQLGAARLDQLLARLRDPGDATKAMCGNLAADDVEALTTQAALASSSQSTLAAASELSKTGGGAVIATAAAVELLLVAAGDAAALKQAAADIVQCQKARPACAAPVFKWNLVGSNACAVRCTGAPSGIGVCSPANGVGPKTCDASNVGRYVAQIQGVTPTNPTDASAFGWVAAWTETQGPFGDAVFHGIDPRVAPPLDCDTSNPDPVLAGIWQCVQE